MPKDGRASKSASWKESRLVDTTVMRGIYHDSVLRDASEDHASESRVVAASVEEKVSDLIRSFPHLEAFLKCRSNNRNARIRDLAISTRERNQLLYQLIAARRQQLFTSGKTERRSLTAREQGAAP